MPCVDFFDILDKALKKMNPPAQISLLHAKFKSQVHKYIKLNDINQRGLTHLVHIGQLKNCR